jgi:hypothetical protein
VVLGGLLGGLVVGVPAGELLGAGLLSGVALFIGSALAGFGQCAARAGEVVGGLLGGGDVDGVVGGSWRFGGGEFPDVGHGCLGERPAVCDVVEGGQFGGVLLGDVGQVVVGGDVAVRVFGEAVGGVCGEPLFGAGGVVGGWLMAWRAARAASAR